MKQHIRKCPDEKKTSGKIPEALIKSNFFISS